MNNWNQYGYCSYSAKVFPRPVRRVLRGVLLFNLTVICSGAVIFSLYSSIAVVREVIAQPRASQSTPLTHQDHTHFMKGQRP